jgi:hypothetical protein
MSTHLAKHLKTLRIERGLKPGQLAALAGCTNVEKNGSRIGVFEQTGKINEELLTKLIVALEVDKELVDRLVEQDRQDWYESWLRWVDTPIEPYITLRMMAAVYRKVTFPPGITQEQAEQAASCESKRTKRQSCLVWSRRLTVWFDEKGELIVRRNAVPGKNDVPYSTIGGKPFVFSNDIPNIASVELPKEPPYEKK